MPSPSAIYGANLKHWVAARLQSGLSNNDPVATPTDGGTVSGTTQGTAASRPTYKTNIINGRPAFFLDGVDDFWTFAAETYSAMTVFAIEQSAGDAWLAGHSTVNQQVRIGNAGANVLSFYTGTGLPQSTTLTKPRTSFSLKVWVYDGSTVSFYEDGVAKGSGAASGNIVLDRLGRGNAGNFLSGYVAEYGFVDRASTAGEIASLWTEMNALYFTTIPTAPSGATATAISPSQVDLSWTDASSNETGFKIQRKVGSGSFADLTTVSSGVTSYSDTTVSGSTTYTYRIIATNAAGDSAGADTSAVTTPAAPTPPAKPTNLLATPQGPNVVSLSWQDNS